MVDDEQCQKEEQKFDFDASGEVVNYISIDQARVLAMRTSSETPGEAVVLIAIVGGVGAVFASGALGGGGDATAPVPGVAVASTATPTPTVAEPAVASAVVTAAEIEALVQAAVAAAAAQGASAEEIEALATLEVEQAAAEAAIPLSTSELEAIAAAAVAAAVSVPEPTADLETLVEMAVAMAVVGRSAEEIQISIGETATKLGTPLSASELDAIVAAALGAIATPAPAVTAAPAVAVATVAPVAVIAQPTAAAAAVAPVAQARGTFNYYHPVSWGGEESLDPAVRERWVPITEMVYDRLIRLNRSGQPRPVLAESWAVNSDATRWTFNIRNGVTFSDGRPLTARDVHYTFEHYLNPDVGTVSGLNFIDPGRIELIDDFTIGVNLDEPHVDLPLQLSSFRFRIIPEGSGDIFGDTGIGTGPFTVGALDVDGVSHLDSRDDYWQGFPGLEGIRVFGIAERSTQVAALRAGQIDMVGELIPNQVEIFDGNSGFVVHENPTGLVQNISIIVTEPLFDNVRLRQALKLVIDPHEMIDVVLRGHGTPACNNPVWPTDQYYWPQDYRQNIGGGAKALLAEAGHPDGLTIELAASDRSPAWLPIAEVYHAQAEEAGITVDIHVFPADTYWTNTWMVHPFAHSNWVMQSADQILNRVFRCGAVWGETFWCNEEFERVMEDARREVSFERRRRLYQRAQQIQVEDGGMIAPFFVNDIRALSTRLERLPADVILREFPWNMLRIVEP